MNAPTAIELPWPPKELSGHHDIHWRVLQPIKKKHRQWAVNAALEVLSQIDLPLDEYDIPVSATFIPPDKRTDRVNMPTRLKPYWDGIADALGVNDRRFLPSFHYAPPQAPGKVIVTIGGDA